MPAWLPDGGLKKFNKITDFAFSLLRFSLFGWQSLARALSALCRFQAAPLRTPAAICQDTGSPGCWPRRPGAALMSLFLFAKVYHIFLIRKKIEEIFQEIFDFVDTQLVTKGNFSGVSGVKRFNDIYYI